MSAIEKWCSAGNYPKIEYYSDILDLPLVFLVRATLTMQRSRTSSQYL